MFNTVLLEYILTFLKHISIFRSFVQHINLFLNYDIGIVKYVHSSSQILFSPSFDSLPT